MRTTTNQRYDAKQAVLAQALPYEIARDSSKTKPLLAAIPPEMWTEWDRVRGGGLEDIALNKIADWIARNYQRILGK